MTDPILQTLEITKRFGAVVALDGVSLEVREGEFLALVGPSGCGKTTLLKIIGGFERPEAGRITIRSEDMSGVPPANRPTSMVFQKLALFPHRTVGQNISFPLKLRGRSADEISRKSAEIMGIMHLPESYIDRYPAELSGGEQQRVALARSMISSPSVLLLDEPLTALDVTLKKSLQAELKRLHRELGVTFLHVTHDLEEAMMLADRICVMRKGTIVQSGRPSDIYYRPVSDFVAGFIGETNLLPVTVRDVSQTRVSYDPVPVRGTEELPRALAAEDIAPGAAHLMVRPELIRVLGTEETAESHVEVRIEESFVKGATIQYRARSLEREIPLVLEIQGTSNPPCRVGDTARVGWERKDIFMFPVRADAGA